MGDDGLGHLAYTAGRSLPTLCTLSAEPIQLHNTIHEDTMLTCGIVNAPQKNLVVFIHMRCRAKRNEQFAEGSQGTMLQPPGQQ